MYSAYIRVVSDSLAQDQLVDALGPHSGDKGRTSGAAARWRRDLFREAPSWPPNLMAYLGHDSEVLADRIRQLVMAGTADAWLVVVQDVDDPDDANQKGISLDREVISWMATAMVGLDLDQYISSPGESGGSEVI